MHNRLNPKPESKQPLLSNRSDEGVITRCLENVTTPMKEDGQLVFTIQHTGNEIPMASEDDLKIILLSSIDGTWTLNKKEPKDLVLPEISPILVEVNRNHLAGKSENEKDRANQLIARLAVWHAKDRQAHVIDPNFRCLSKKTFDTVKTAGHVVAEGWLKPLGWLLAIVYAYQNISGKLAKEGSTTPEPYPWEILAAYALPFVLLASQLTFIQGNYARGSFTEVKPKQAAREYWDPQTIMALLHKEFGFYVDFNDAETRIKTDRQDIPALWLEPNHPAAIKVARSSRLNIAAVAVTETGDGVALAVVLGSPMLSKLGPVPATIITTIIGMLGGAGVKAVAAIANSTGQHFTLQDGEYYFNTGERHTPAKDRNPQVMGGPLKMAPLLTVALPLLFSGAHAASIHNLGLTRELTLQLMALVIPGSQIKTSLYDIPRIGVALDVSAKAMEETPYSSMKAGNSSAQQRTWKDKVAKALSLTWMLPNENAAEWKHNLVIFLAISSYAPGLFALAFESTLNVGKHLVFPMLPELLATAFESLAPNILPGPILSQAGFFSAVVGATVACPQSHQLYKVLRNRQVQ